MAVGVSAYGWFSVWIPWLLPCSGKLHDWEINKTPRITVHWQEWIYLEKKKSCWALRGKTDVMETGTGSRSENSRCLHCISTQFGWGILWSGSLINICADIGLIKRIRYWPDVTTIHLTFLFCFVHGLQPQCVGRPLLWNWKCWQWHLWSDNII